MLALAGAAVAAYLVYARYTGTRLACTTGGCETVQHSKYAKAAGIPVAVLGLAAYVAVFATALSARVEAAAIGAAIVLAGLAFGVYLIVIQVAVIDAICQWCLASDAILAVLAVACAERLRRSSYAATATGGLISARSGLEQPLELLPARRGEAAVLARGARAPEGRHARSRRPARPRCRGSCEVGLSPHAAERAGARADHGDRLAVERGVAARAGGPVDRVLQLARAPSRCTPASRSGRHRRRRSPRGARDGLRARRLDVVVLVVGGTAFSPSKSSNSTPAGRSFAASSRSRRLCESRRRLPLIPRIRMSLRLRQLEVGGQLDLVLEHGAAARELHVPGDPEVGAVDHGLEGDADPVVRPGRRSCRSAGRAAARRGSPARPRRPARRRGGEARST